MYQAFGDLLVAITEHPAQVGEYLAEAQKLGLERIIAVGGDGTCHAIINALMDLQDRHPDSPRMTFGQLPMGTGQDFARILGIPPKPEAAIPWLARARPRMLDVGVLDYEGGRRYFLNIASAGISGEVDRRVTGIPRRPWTFWLATVASFLRYPLPQVRLSADGRLIYEGKIWLLAAANGSTFGRGMRIAPGAQIDDGRLEMILVKQAPRWEAVWAFNLVYGGRHMKHRRVQAAQVQSLELEALGGEIALDLDGEPSTGRQLRFSLRPGALQMLSAGKD
jgi:YegS/Rv2252/BmrU family lipid kinase